MERKIGEVFEFDGKQYEVCKTNKTGINICSECCIRSLCESETGGALVIFSGECLHYEREDNKDVVFKEFVPNIKTFK